MTFHMGFGGEGCGGVVMKVESLEDLLPISLLLKTP